MRDHAPATFYRHTSGITEHTYHRRQTYADDAREPIYILLLRVDQVVEWVDLLLCIAAGRWWYDCIIVAFTGRGRGGWCAKNTAAAVRRLRSR